MRDVKFYVSVVCIAFFHFYVQAQKSQLELGVSFNTLLYNSETIKLNIYEQNGYFDYSNTRFPDLGLSLSYGVSDRISLGVGFRYRRMNSFANTELRSPINGVLIATDYVEWNNEYSAIELFSTWSIDTKNRLSLRFSLNSPVQWGTNNSFESFHALFASIEVVDGEYDLFLYELFRRKYQTGSSLNHAYLSCEYNRQLWKSVWLALGLEKNVINKDVVYELRTGRSEVIIDDLEVTTGFFGVYVGLRMNLKLFDFNR